MCSKISPENSPVICDGYVKYEEVEVDRSVIMLDYRNKEKKLLKMTTSRPFFITFLQNLSMFYIHGPVFSFFS